MDGHSVQKNWSNSAAVLVKKNQNFAFWVKKTPNFSQNATLRPKYFMKFFALLGGGAFGIALDIHQISTFYDNFLTGFF